MPVLPKIDVKQTKENVDNLLNGYHRLRRMAGQPIDQKITASYSIEPMSPSTDNTSKIEKQTIKKIDAEIEKKSIDYAHQLCSVDARKRLYNHYMNPSKLLIYEICEAENISKKTYYRELEKAQIEFAEAYNGKVNLLVYESDTNLTR